MLDCSRKVEPTTEISQNKQEQEANDDIYSAMGKLDDSRMEETAVIRNFRNKKDQAYYEEMLRTVVR